MATIKQDLEKPSNILNVVDTSSGGIVQQYPSSQTQPYLQKLNAHIENLSGFEARGITRVLPEERQQRSLSNDV